VIRLSLKALAAAAIGGVTYVLLIWLIQAL
jgi:hypothetical protein